MFDAVYDRFKQMLLEATGRLKVGTADTDDYGPVINEEQMRNMLAAVERAQAAGFTALVVTIDTGVPGLRERDLRNGMKQLVSGNPLKMFPYLFQFLSRPGWVLGYLRDGGLMNFPNVVLPDGPMPYAQVRSGSSGRTLRRNERPRAGSTHTSPTTTVTSGSAHSR